MSDSTEPRHQLTRKFSRGRDPATPPVTPTQSVATPLLQLEPSTEEPTGWLCSAIVPAIPLRASRLTIGRHSESNLVLPHKSVSRQHALIKTRGRVIVYEDLGSSNGSFVNGIQLEGKKPRVLRAGDQLGIGPYAFELRSSPDELLETSGERMFKRMQGDAPPALVGKIHEVPLAEVIQGIEFNKKTCTLEVEFGERRGSLVVRKGVPLTATWGTLTDEHAVLAMLSLMRGQFYLTNRQTVDAPQTMRTGLRLLLFEALRRCDEAGDDFDTASI